METIKWIPLSDEQRARALTTSENTSELPMECKKTYRRPSFMTSTPITPHRSNEEVVERRLLEGNLMSYDREIEVLETAEIYRTFYQPIFSLVQSINFLVFLTTILSKTKLHS